MFKRLLIAVLLLSSGFQFFVNGSEVTSQSKPLKVILFVDFEKIRSKSDEWNYLEEQVKFIQEQQLAVSKKYQELCFHDGTRDFDAKKRDEHNQLLKEAGIISKAYLGTLERPLSLWDKKMKVIIQRRAKKLKAGAVISKEKHIVAYLGRLNNITDYVIDELNKEYRQGMKQIYPTCDLFSFIKRMNEVGSIYFQ